ncbi:MAG: hypothetical protein IH899_04835 [Planctomycetes bacterium]|nr:hypothetical protein [Planctomycetota bacterium]
MIFDRGCKFQLGFASPAPGPDRFGPGIFFDREKENEKNEILALFNKRIVARNFNVIIAKDFSALEGFKLLFQQDMSAQRLFDTVNEAIFLLQDLGELFYQADQSLKVPKVSKTSQRMLK